jgi:peptidoglycan/xylan/chitin deacetylase (PgdA/CDA1 family)
LRNVSGYLPGSENLAREKGGDKHLLKQKSKNLIAFIFGNRLCIRGIRYFNKNKLRILYYHRVTKDGEEAHAKVKDMCTKYESFKQQMEYLKEVYHPVGEEEIIAAIEKQTNLPDHPVWVTFDDGYKDNFTNAYPILKELSIPATFFITTGFINRTEAPADDALCLDSKGLSDLFMTWEEIMDLRKNGVSIGGHTATHKILSAIKLVESENEILESKKEIEERIQAKIYSFAYPHGKKADIDFDVHPKILQRCGFKLAVTTVGGFNSMDRKGQNLTLRRMGVSYEDNLNMFELKVSTACPWQR